MGYGWMAAKLSIKMTSAWLLVAALHPVAVQAQDLPFSLICMPDPQYYTTSNHPSLYNLYQRQAQWIRNNKTAYNIQHVIWLGDLTNDNTLTQWQTADSAYDILDQAAIPFAVVPGNHDYKTPLNGWVGSHLRNLSRYNNYVGPDRFAGKSWYGGNMGETTNQNENNYTYFSANGLDFLVIGLEYAPRKEVLTWANQLISQHPNHRVILFTHAYMTTNGAYIGGGGSAFGIVGADGQEIFEECANRHSNVFMVVCGHVTESVTNTRFGVGGNIIYEMLVDYQGEKVKGTGANLGNGWLRILQFDPANNKINASTVTAAFGDPNIFEGGITQFYLSSRYNTSAAGKDHLFSMDYNMDSLEPYTYLNASVDFHPMSISGDLSTDQLDPAIGQADNGNWACVWEDDHDDNGIYRIMVRGYDSDGNVRFQKSVVNTTGANVVNATNPSIAMAADGKFVVVWQSGANQISMRRYNADGTPVGVGDSSAVTVAATGTVNNPDVAMDDAGNYVVTWADDADGNGYFQVKARGFTSALAQRFTAKNVNTVSTGQQINPAIAMAGNGDYVIAWEDDKDGTWDLGIRAFLADETERFAQIVGNTIVDGEQRSPDVAMDDSGNFVLVWEDDADLNSSYQILAKGFGPAGAERITQRTVNMVGTGNQIRPVVDMDSLGNWYVAWEDNGVSGEGYQIMSNAFNSNGTRIHDADIRANKVTAVTHTAGTPVRKTPAVSAHKSGRYIVLWADDMDGDALHHSLARGIGGTANSLVIKAINGEVTRSSDDPFYAPNQVVTLTATPDEGHSFVRWAGDVPFGSETANPLTITMTTNKRLTAEFTGSAEVTDWQLY